MAVARETGRILQRHELEFIQGEIYANFWHSDLIARISPRDGHLIAWMDLKGLLPAKQRIDDEAVLNYLRREVRPDFCNREAMADGVSDRGCAAFSGKMMVQRSYSGRDGS